MPPAKYFTIFLGPSPRFWLTRGVARKPSTASVATEQSLFRWRLIGAFKKRWRRAAAKTRRAATWTHPGRKLTEEDYLSLSLFGLLNPVVRTARGLCAASGLARVQRDVCTRPVRLGSFSPAQTQVAPAVLAAVFAELTREVCATVEHAHQRRWLIQDGSLFEALPRMYWAFWRRQGTGQHQVRLHLSLDLAQAAPARVTVTPGKGCERAAWRTQVQPGDGYVADRYYGEDYQLFRELEATRVAFVVRLRDQAVINVLEELPLTAADRQAHVTRSVCATLGCNPRQQSIRVRLVWVQTDKELICLVTNLPPEELSAGEVAQLYKERWRIELFFRWLKCLLGCRHWLAESPAGVTVQLYLALIAALLLQRHTGLRPTKRMLELIQFYLLGVASLKELKTGLAGLQPRQKT